MENTSDNGARRRRGLHWGWWLAIAFAAFLLACAAMLFGIFSLMKNSDAYRTAVVALNADAGVEKAIGHPISTGWATGNIHTVNAEGDAQLRFDVDGPRGKGHVSVSLLRHSGEWRVEEGQLVVEGTRESIAFGPESGDDR